MDKRMKIALISVDETIAMLGVRDLSAQLKDLGFEVKVLSMQGQKNEKYFSEHELSLLSKFISDCKFVGVSSVVINKEKAKQVLSVAKEIGILTIWGGVHATLFYKECTEYCDYVCIGEGEKALSEVAYAIKNNVPLNHINNLVYKEKETNKIILNSLNPLIVNLDAQPLPDHDINSQYILTNGKLITIADYLAENNSHIGRDMYIYIYSSKGCPYSCTYCSNSKLNEIYSDQKITVRYKSIPRVIEEIKLLKDIYKDYHKVWIMDDSFLTRPVEELRDFSKRYIKEINLPLDFFAAPNMITFDKMSALMPVEISLIRIGVQSGSDNTLHNIYNRRIKGEHIITASNVLLQINQQYKTSVNAVYQVIINNPYESKEDLLQTINLIRNIKPPFFLSTFFLIYFPGSKIYERAIADGIIEKDNSDQEFLAENIRNHLNESSKNLYLNSILFAMYGEANDEFIGILPRNVINWLVSSSVIDFFEKHTEIILEMDEVISKKQKSLVEFLDLYKAKTVSNKRIKHET